MFESVKLDKEHHFENIAIARFQQVLYNMYIKYVILRGAKMRWPYILPISNNYSNDSRWLIYFT